MDEERQVFIARTLFDEHDAAMPVAGEPRDFAWDQLKDALGHVPQTEAWATDKHRPIVFALPDDGDVLFVLEVMADAHVAIQVQRLRSKDLTVRYVRRSRTNEWLFTYPDETAESIQQPWQRIELRGSPAAKRTSISARRSLALSPLVWAGRFVRRSPDPRSSDE